MNLTFCKSCKNNNNNSIECVDCQMDLNNGIPTKYLDNKEKHVGLKLTCYKCGAEMRHNGDGYYECLNCHTMALSIVPEKPQIYVKQEPYVDDNGIWMPYEEYVLEGCASNYRLVLSKEMFVEAYNKWIKGE